MKKLTVMITLVLAMLLLYGCTAPQNTNEVEVAEHTVVLPENAVVLPWGVAVYADEVTSGGLVLRFLNTRGTDRKTVETGRDFSVEQKTDSGWIDVPLLPGREEPVWPMDMLIYDTTQTVDINWTTLYGRLEPGSYRLVKGFSSSREQNGEWDHCTIPFEVHGI